MPDRPTRRPSVARAPARRVSGLTVITGRCGPFANPSAAHQLLVVLGLMHAGRTGESRASAAERASRRGSPIARGCRRARRCTRCETSSAAAARRRRIAPSARRSIRPRASRTSTSLTPIPRHRGHEREERRDGRPRGNRQRGASGQRAAYVGNRRQRHHGVAEPVRRDYDKALQVWYGLSFHESAPLRP